MLDRSQRLLFLCFSVVVPAFAMFSTRQNCSFFGKKLGCKKKLVKRPRRHNLTLFGDLMATSKDFFLIGIAVVYLIAFSSLYVQIPG